MEHLPALQVVVPLLTAPLVVLLRSPGLAWAAATAASVMSFIISVALVGQDLVFVLRGTIVNAAVAALAHFPLEPQLKIIGDFRLGIHQTAATSGARDHAIFDNPIA